MNRFADDRSPENEPRPDDEIRSANDRLDRSASPAGDRSDPAEPAAHESATLERRALILEYVDGAMTLAAARAFEATLRESPEWTRDVERARCLRALVSTLPRVAAPESVRRYTANLAKLPRAAATPSATPEQYLAALPRRVAPTALRDSVLSAIRRERVIVEVARERRAFRPSFRTLAPMAVAAALLVGVTTWLFESREVSVPRRAGARTFLFEVSTLRPGEQSIAYRWTGSSRSDEASRGELSPSPTFGSGISRVDLTLVPPSFAPSDRDAGGGR